MHRDPASDYKRMLFNQHIYNIANIPRIDTFIIKLIRDHIYKALRNTVNNEISRPFRRTEQEIQKTIRKCYLPAEAFPTLDKGGFIQSDSNVPIIYHVIRRIKYRKIVVNKDMVAHDASVLRYSTALPPIDIRENSRSKIGKYPWLA